MEEHRTMKGIHPTVIIGTPGRMSDHLRKENFNAATVVTLVIDEFDKCLEFGFHDEMAEVIGQLPSLKKRVLLSATDAEEIPQFAGVPAVRKILSEHGVTREGFNTALAKVKTGPVTQSE